MMNIQQSEVERFNENLDEFKRDDTKSNHKVTLLKKTNLENIENNVHNPSQKLSSFRFTVSDAKRNSLLNRRNFQMDCSTVKTLDILRMINSVNDLREKTEII
jgi:hypothetical protein